MPMNGENVLWEKIGGETKNVRKQSQTLIPIPRLSDVIKSDAVNPRLVEGVNLRSKAEGQHIFLAMQTNAEVNEMFA